MQSSIPSALLVHTDGELGLNKADNTATQKTLQSTYVESRFKVMGINVAA